MIGQDEPFRQDIDPDRPDLVRRRFLVTALGMGGAALSLRAMQGRVLTVGTAGRETLCGPPRGADGPGQPVGAVEMRD